MARIWSFMVQFCVRSELWMGCILSTVKFSRLIFLFSSYSQCGCKCLVSLIHIVLGLSIYACWNLYYLCVSLILLPLGFAISLVFHFSASQVTACCISSRYGKCRSYKLIICCNFICDDFLMLFIRMIILLLDFSIYFLWEEVPAILAFLLF